MPQLIGRGEEFAQLLGVLAPDGPRRVHLAAAAGMGKTSVWRAFVEAAAQAPGVEVLTARPLESEVELGLSGLTDLLSGVPGEVYDDLPEPQRMALRAALLLEHAEQSDPRALAVGVRGVLERLAAHGTCVVAVDDAHWLDASSASVLSQVLARAEDTDLRVVVAARPEGRPVDSWLPDAQGGHGAADGHRVAVPPGARARRGRPRPGAAAEAGGGIRGQPLACTGGGPGSFRGQRPRPRH